MEYVGVIIVGNLTRLYSLVTINYESNLQVVSMSARTVVSIARFPHPSVTFSNGPAAFSNLVLKLNHPTLPAFW